MPDLLESSMPVVEFDMSLGQCHNQPWLLPLFFASTATFQGKQDVQEAKSICRDCVIKQECLEYAMSDPRIDGVWGGTNLIDRQAIRSERYQEEKARKLRERETAA